MPLWYIERELANAQNAKEAKSPNVRPRMTLVGAGGVGTIGAGSSLRFADLVAVCDVEGKNLERCIKQM